MLPRGRRPVEGVPAGGRRTLVLRLPPLAALLPALLLGLCGGAARALPRRGHPGGLDALLHEEHARGVNVLALLVPPRCAEQPKCAALRAALERAEEELAVSAADGLVYPVQLCELESSLPASRLPALRWFPCADAPMDVPPAQQGDGVTLARFVRQWGGPLLRPLREPGELGRFLDLARTVSGRDILVLLAAHNATGALGGHLFSALLTLARADERGLRLAVLEGGDAPAQAVRAALRERGVAPDEAAAQLGEVSEALFLVRAPRHGYECEALAELAARTAECPTADAECGDSALVEYLAARVERAATVPPAATWFFSAPLFEAALAEHEFALGALIADYSDPASSEVVASVEAVAQRAAGDGLLVDASAPGREEGGKLLVAVTATSRGKPLYSRYMVTQLPDVLWFHKGDWRPVEERDPQRLLAWVRDRMQPVFSRQLAEGANVDDIGAFTAFLIAPGDEEEEMRRSADPLAPHRVGGRAVRVVRLRRGSALGADSAVVDLACEGLAPEVAFLDAPAPDAAVWDAFAPADESDEVLLVFNKEGAVRISRASHPDIDWDDYLHVRAAVRFAGYERVARYHDAYIDDAIDNGAAALVLLLCSADDDDALRTFRVFASTRSNDGLVFAHVDLSDAKGYSRAAALDYFVVGDAAAGDGRAAQAMQAGRYIRALYLDEQGPGADLFEALGAAGTDALQPGDVTFERLAVFVDALLAHELEPMDVLPPPGLDEGSALDDEHDDEPYAEEP